MVVQLAETTRAELTMINGSAYEIQQLYIVQRESSDWPWKGLVLSIFAFFNQSWLRVFCLRTYNLCSVIRTGSAGGN